MPLSGDFSCFKSKSNTTLKQQQKIENDIFSDINVHQSMRKRSTTSFLKKFISFESLLGSCKRSSQSSITSNSRNNNSNSKKKNSINLNFPQSKTNETFSNDDEEPNALSLNLDGNNSANDASPPVSTLSSYANKKSSNHFSMNNVNEEFNDESFRKILAEFNLSDDQIESLLKLTEENKYNIYKSYMNKSNSKSEKETLADTYIVSMNLLAEYINMTKNSSLNDAQIFNNYKMSNFSIDTKSSSLAINDTSVPNLDIYVNQVESLKLALRARPLSFVNNFLELKGLESLLNLLESLYSSWRYHKIHLSLIICIKELMNNTNGRQSVLNYESAINIIAQSLYNSSIKVKTLVLEILSAICYLEGGHEKVLKAITYYQVYAHERVRFQSIVNFLDEEFPDCDKIIKGNLKIASMSFINSLLFNGEGEKNLDFRLHLRYEFLTLGIQNILNGLVKCTNKILEKHIDFFETKRLEDENSYLSILNGANGLIDLNNNEAASDECQINNKNIVNNDDENPMLSFGDKIQDLEFLFDLINKQLKYTTSYSNWSSILQHLLLVNVKNKSVLPSYWKIIDIAIQQISLQASGKDLDRSLVNINFNEIIERMNKKSELKELNELRDLNDSLKKEVNDLKSKLQHIEIKLKSISNEKDVQASNCNELRKLLNEEMTVRKKYESELKKINSPILHVKTDIPDVSDLSKSYERTSPGARAPPPPPPPPPPPFFASSPLNSSSSMAKKNVPKSKVQMKGFNWNKKARIDFNNSIWENIDDKSFYDKMDISEFEKSFSMPQSIGQDPYRSLSVQTNVNDNEYELSQSLPLSPIAKFPRFKLKEEFSVLDKNRAQNIEIFLKNNINKKPNKLQNQDVIDLINTMDPDSKFDTDFLELLKPFLPTEEEKKLLHENRHEFENFKEADRFLYEISKIFRLNEKIKCLSFKKRFNDKLNDLKIKFDMTIKCCDVLKNNKNIVELLHLVLCMGNFMNQSNKNGNASGFSIFSLNKLIDVKSSSDSKFTLLHYLVNTIETKFPHALEIVNELSSVQELCRKKFSMENMTSDLKQIEEGLKLYKTEIEIYKKKADELNEKDLFLKDAIEFYETHISSLEEIKSNYINMKNKYSKTVSYFGEDETKILFEDFFSLWDDFVESFKRVKAELTIKKTQTNRTDLYNTIRSKQRSNINRAINTTEECNAVFDSIIHEVTTGGRYGLSGMLNPRGKVNT